MHTNKKMQGFRLLLLLWDGRIHLANRQPDCAPWKTNTDEGVNWFVQNMDYFGNKRNPFSSASISGIRYNGWLLRKKGGASWCYPKACIYRCWGVLLRVAQDWGTNGWKGSLGAHFMRQGVKRRGQPIKSFYWQKVYTQSGEGKVWSILCFWWEYANEMKGG